MQNPITSSKKQANKQQVKLRVAAGATASASNTRTKKAAHDATVQPQSQPPKQSARISCLVQPTRSSKAKSNAGTSNAVEVRRNNRQMRWLTRHITKMETKVHQAMAVMDAESGTLLN